MNSTPARLALRINVFELSNQPALALPGQSAAEFIQSILQEFHELEYLSDRPELYQLLHEDQSPLDDEGVIGDQLAAGEQLYLIERPSGQPMGTQRPSCPIYLRAIANKIVYPLGWLPAVIGRRDEDLPYNERIAVDLEALPNGLRVSRRHLVITEEDGRFYVASLSANPASLQRSASPIDALLIEKKLLQHGDVIHLTRSDIKLKFIIRAGCLHVRSHTLND
jgi:hypothetical protein